MLFAAFKSGPCDIFRLRGPAQPYVELLRPSSDLYSAFPCRFLCLWAFQIASIESNSAPCVGKLTYLVAWHSLPQGLPQQFAEYLAYCRSLKFEAKPNVPYLQVSAIGEKCRHGCTRLTTPLVLLLFAVLARRTCLCRNIDMFSLDSRDIQIEYFVSFIHNSARSV